MSCDLMKGYDSQTVQKNKIIMRASTIDKDKTNKKPANFNGCHNHFNDAVFKTKCQTSHEFISNI